MTPPPTLCSVSEVPHTTVLYCQLLETRVLKVKAVMRVRGQEAIIFLARNSKGEAGEGGKAGEELIFDGQMGGGDK